MKYTFTLLIIMVFSFSIASQAIENDFVFNQNLVIGQNVEEILGLPISVISDSEGRIIISDDKTGSIKIYSKDGELSQTIGRTGRGPGEFLRFDSITILPNDEILVYDFILRRFTRLNSLGEVIRIDNLPKETYLNSDVIYYNKNLNSLFTFYRTIKGKRMAVPAREDFLGHIISLDSFTATENFIPITHTIDTNDNFERYFEGSLFKGIFTANDSVITVAPYFYRGKILQYKLRNQTWEQQKAFKGHVETDRTYESFNDPQKVRGKGMAAKREKYGAIAGIMKNESLGLFQKGNGDYLYLGLLEINGKQELYVNLFDKKGELKAHGPVTNLNPGLQKNDFYRRMRFYWIDDQDQIYIIDGAENGFFVYRGTIEMKNE